ncbi:SRPBCC domain-containing protein, partial [Actinotalea sp. BY-33]
ECEPPRRYTTTWEYAGESPSTVEVTVTEHPEGAVLTLRHTDLADAGYGAGWQAYLEQLARDRPAAASSAVDPDRPAGVSWDARFAALHAVWGPR